MTNETKHTPGPWCISEGEGFSADLPAGYVIDYVENGLGDTVAMVATKEKFPFDNLTANAHLIAAAPELYEVLNEAMQRGGVIQMCLYEKALYALAKARGEV